eukprot:COSAG01_NODE_1199_length_11292_cov_69.798267_4_plen_166_part_00
MAAVLLMPAVWTIYVLVTAWWGKSRHWSCDPPTTPTTAGGDIHIHVHPKESVEALHSSANVSGGSWDTGNTDDLLQPAPGFGRSQAQRSLQGSEAACKLRSDAPDSKISCDAAQPPVAILCLGRRGTVSLTGCLVRPPRLQADLLQPEDQGRVRGIPADLRLGRW